MPPDLVDAGYYRRIERRRGTIGAGRDDEGGSQGGSELIANTYTISFTSQLSFPPPSDQDT